MKRGDVTVRLLRDQVIGGRQRHAGDWVTVDPQIAEKMFFRHIAEAGPDWTENVGPKHVLMVSKANSSRVSKEAIGMRLRGWRVDSLSCGLPQFLDAYDMMKVVPECDFAAEIAASGASIIHVHNEPDVLMRYADKGARGRPVVYDCHDMELHRFGRVTDDERFAFSRADGIIHTSSEYKHLAGIHHGHHDPSRVVHSCPMRAWAPDMRAYRGRGQKKRQGIVYAGGSTPSGLKLDDFRDHRILYQMITEKGLSLDMIVPSDARPAYPGSRALLPYMEMMNTLPRYRWGLLGMHRETKKWNVCIPNKLFEYLACGLPIMGPCAKAVERYMGGKGGVYSYRSRYVVARVNRMPDDEWRELQRQAMKRRRFMDDESEEIESLYAELLGFHPCPVCGKHLRNELAVRMHVATVHDKTVGLRRA